MNFIEELNLIEIFTKIKGNIKAVKPHIETVVLKPEALKKAIQRVKSDHGNEYGIRIDRQDLPLHDGDI